MVHPADDLRSHITWSPAGLLWIALFSFAGHPKISNSEVTVLFKNQILRLKVPMDDSLGVDVLKSQNDATRYEF